MLILHTSHCISPTWIICITFSSTEINFYKTRSRLNYRVKLAQHPHKMWQYISRCLPQLNPTSWRKVQLKLFPAMSWRRHFYLLKSNILRVTSVIISMLKVGSCKMACVGLLRPVKSNHHWPTHIIILLFPHIKVNVVCFF